MTHDAENSAEIYAYLQSQTPRANKLTVRSTGVVTANGEAMHAVDGNGSASLLVPVAAADQEHVDWQNQAVTFGYRNIDVDGATQTFLVLQCTAPKVLGQFSLMADDILESVARHPDMAAATTRRTVDRWKELFRDRKAPILSDEKLIGLFGELKFLEELLPQHGSDALTAWQGPHGGRHDFTFKNAGVEVKTTTSRDIFSVTFHGWKQLEAPIDAQLFVRGYQVEPSVAGESVPQLLRCLYEGGINRFSLLRALEQVGYSETDTDYYSGRRFAVIGMRTVLVDSTFPRLTAETVPAAIVHRISALRYTVDLGPQAETELIVLELGVEE